MARKRVSVGIDCSIGGPSRAKQEMRDECDINYLMDRFQRTGVLVDPSMVGKRQAAFEDYTDVGDFTDCQNRLVAAREAFESLDAKVRRRFANDPGRVIEFLSDVSNRSEAIALGLIAEPVVAPATTVDTPEGGVVLPPDPGDGGTP